MDDFSKQASQVVQWQLTLVFLPGKSHGQRSLAGYSPWGHKESDMTWWLSMHFLKIFLGFVAILSLFYVFVSWPLGMWDPSSPSRDQILNPCFGRRSTNHWTAREVPPFFYQLINLSFVSEMNSVLFYWLKWHWAGGPLLEPNSKGLVIIVHLMAGDSIEARFLEKEGGETWGME